MWCRTILAKEGIHGLFPVPTFNCGSSNCFLNSFHEAFIFAVGSWPVWSYLTVLKTEVIGKVLKLFTIKWRAII